MRKQLKLVEFRMVCFLEKVKLHKYLTQYQINLLKNTSNFNKIV